MIGTTVGSYRIVSRLGAGGWKFEPGSAGVGDAGEGLSLV
jgi:hypothetical protein